MEASIIIIVTGAPVPWARAGRHGRGTYTPMRVRRWQDDARQVARAAMGNRLPIKGPVRLEFTAVLRIPRSWPDWKRQAALAGRVRPTCRPDKDNLVKALMDACNTIVWADDAQVVESDASKVYGERLEVRATVRPIAAAGHTITRRDQLPGP